MKYALGGLSNQIFASKYTLYIPNKEVFEKAGIGLGLLCDECLVVEDAASGVEGAKRAGMEVAGIGDAKNLSDVTFHLESFEDLQKYCR